MRDHQQNSLRRPAFTLIEIVVTVAIILILASLSLWGVGAVMTGRHRNNTIATISVINKVFEDHWRYVIAEAKKDFDSPVGISPAVMALAQPDPDGSRAKALWIKFRLMEAFPQTFQEITSPFVYTNCSLTNSPYIPPNQARYNGYYNTAAAQADLPNYVAQVFPAVQAGSNPYAFPKTKPVTESSACLRIALSVSRGGNALTDDMIKYAIADTDNDGVKEIVDSWGNPLLFFRFAWNNSAVQGANPATGGRNAKLADPIDTSGSFVNRSWYFGPGQPTLIRKSLEETLSFHPFALTQGWAYTPNKFPNVPANPPQELHAPYVIPVIVSAGSDGKYGYTVITPGQTSTTITTPPTANTVDANPETPSPASGIYIVGGTQRFHPEMSLSSVPAHSAWTNDNIVSFLLK